MLNVLIHHSIQRRVFLSFREIVLYFIFVTYIQ